MSQEFLEIPLNGATVFLTGQELEDLLQEHGTDELRERIHFEGMTRNEINLLLLQNVPLYREGLRRGKAIKRSRKQKDREAAKLDQKNHGQHLH